MQTYSMRRRPRQGAGSEQTHRESWDGRDALARSGIKGRQVVCLLRLDSQGEYEGGIELGFSRERDHICLYW